MMYTIVLSILSTLIPCMMFADTHTQPTKKPIERVIHVGNVTENTYKVYLKDGHHKYHEPALLPPGCTQYMFCRTTDISLISFQPCQSIGKSFRIEKPISEMIRVDCYDQNSLENNFHFYIFPDHSIRSFPAASPQDLEIIKEVENHTFVAPSRPFTTPFTKNS